MRILVAGGHGQVGSALARLGAEMGLDLIAVGRKSLDVTDTASIALAFERYRPDLLINAAAYTAVDEAEDKVELAYLVNDRATALLADACVAANIPMFHISTDYVFDGVKEGAYREDDSVNPLGVYGKSKEAGERALRVRVYRHIILRTSWVFGEFGKNFVKTIVRLAKDRDRLTVVNDQFGGPSGALGIAGALIQIARQFERGGEVNWGTYHYCGKPFVSWYQFAKIIIERASELGILSHRVEILPINSSEFMTKGLRPLNSRLDVSKYEFFFKNPSLSWIDELDIVLESLSQEE